MEQITLKNSHNMNTSTHNRHDFCSKPCDDLFTIIIQKYNITKAYWLVNVSPVTECSYLKQFLLWINKRLETNSFISIVFDDVQQHFVCPFESGKIFLPFCINGPSGYKLNVWRLGFLKMKIRRYIHAVIYRNFLLGTTKERFDLILKTFYPRAIYERIYKGVQASCSEGSNM